MSSRDMLRWETGISRVRGGDNDEITVRGHDLGDLIGKIDFAGMTYLVLTGRLPSEGQAVVLNALLVAAVEHGIAPPSMISRCFASYGTNLQAAIAGGVLSFGDKMGGAGEQLAKLMSECIAALPKGTDSDDEALTQEAQRVVKNAKRKRERLAGFGIPLHKQDPRAPALLDVARRENVLGVYSRFARILENELEASSGKAIPLNLDGVGAALVLDLGLPWQSTRLFIIAPRTISMAAHYIEESQQDTIWRHIREDQIDYMP